MNNAQWEMSYYLQRIQLTKYVIHCLFPHTYVCTQLTDLFLYMNDKTAQLFEREQK